MRKWFTAIMLVAAVTGGAMGVGAHQGEGPCPMSNMPDCCKKAQSAGQTAEVSMARVCCNLNCSEPGSSGSNGSGSISQPGIGLVSALITNPRPIVDLKFSREGDGSHRPGNSNPKYIQHLAFLI